MTLSMADDTDDTLVMVDDTDDTHVTADDSIGPSALLHHLLPPGPRSHRQNLHFRPGNPHYHLYQH